MAMSGRFLTKVPSRIVGSGGISATYSNRIWTISLETLGSVVFEGVTIANGGLHLLDTDASHDLIVTPGSDLTADRTLTITTGDVDRALELSGNLTIGGAFTTVGAVSIPAIAQGDLWYGSATGVISALAKDTNATRYLSNTGASNNPVYAQVNLADGVTGVLPNANLASMVEATFKGRPIGAGAGVPLDMTGTQTTAGLNAFAGDAGSGGTKGLVPAPAAGDAAAAKYLRANGTWDAPVPGTGDMVKSTYDPNLDGVIAVAQGGTGQVSAAAAFDAIKQIATTSSAGVLEIAEDGEAFAKADATRALVPANLAALGATATFAGFVELATDAEARTGTDTARAVTPAGVRAAEGLQLLSTKTASASATISFLAADGIGATYEGYLITFTDIQPVNDGVGFQAQWTSDGGSSWLATNYDVALMNVTVGTATVTVFQAAAQTSMALSGLVGFENGEGVNGQIQISSFTGTRSHRMSIDTSACTVAALLNTCKGHAWRTGTSGTLNGIRFLFSAGNIAEGTFRLYGIRSTA